MREEHDHQVDEGQLDLLNSSVVPVSLNSGKTKITEKSIESDLFSEGSLIDLRSLPEMLLIVDTETTGLNSEKDKCIEVGVVLFHVVSRSVLAQQSFLLPALVNEAEDINRISAETTRLKQPWQEAIKYMQALISSADLVVAHNAAFDKQWFGKEPLPSIDKPWLCTMDDISWPTQLHLGSRPSVRDLALAYGVPVWNAHRALTDCIYLSEVFVRCNDLEKLLLYGLEPRRLMRAKVSYEERHLAKKAGFRWNDPVRGAWTRRLSERQVSELEFPVVVIEDLQN